MEPILALRGIRKAFSGQAILKGIDLSVEQGGFVTLLGPSGCGKTTLLRIISGLLRPEEGKVFFRGEDITALPPEKRNFTTVFQGYSLFPHMNVAQNVAYGLKLRRIPVPERRERVAQTLRMVRMEGMEKRRVTQLSGGQQQRVAIARAVVLNPDVLLLDEPLGALDLKLRREMQAELKELASRLRLSCVYITHDQEEALNLSTKIIVMNEGKIMQTGTPDEVFNHPANRFTADFIGDSNLYEGTVEKTRDGVCAVTLPFGKVFAADQGFAAGQKVGVCIRPDDVELEKSSAAGSFCRGVVESRAYFGSVEKTTVRLADGGVIHSNRRSAGEQPTVGDEVCVGVSPSRVALFREERV